MKPTPEEAAKIWDICDEYSVSVRTQGWTWKEAVNFIIEHWDDEEFNNKEYYRNILQS